MKNKKCHTVGRRVGRYQRGKSESVNRGRTDNIMAKRNKQKDKQLSTKHTHKTKDRVTRTSIKYGGEQFQNPIEKSYEEAK